MRKHTTIVILLAGLTLDLVSMNAWGYAAFAVPAFVAAVALVATAAFSDIRLGVAAVLLELMWGSFGRMLVLPTFGTSVSLRMGVFAVVFLASIWHLRNASERQQVVHALAKHPARWAAAAFAASLLLAGALGALRYPFALFASDANAWMFLLLTPAFILAIAQGHRGYTRLDTTDFFTRVLLAGGLYLIFRTYALLFVFSHDLGGTWVATYQWVRDTRMGEMTIFAGEFPRVFLQSMVWLFPALLIAAMSLRGSSSNRGNPGPPCWSVFGGSVAVLLISLSRSYWLALATLGGGGLLWFLWQKVVRSRAPAPFPARAMVRAVLAMIGAVLLAVALVRMPYPQPLTTAGFGATLAARFQQDEAVGNRWQEIGPLRTAIAQHWLLGNGFGRTVTYETKDLRTLAVHPDGRYTTTAFEWGYLDDLLERGILGFLAELWLLGVVIVAGMRRGGLARPIALALLAVALIHATSPYLNHPLGLGLLMLAYAVTWKSVMSSPFCAKGAPASGGDSP